MQKSRCKSRNQVYLGYALQGGKRRSQLTPHKFFQGFVLWKEEKVVHLRYLNLKSKYGKEERNR